MSEIITGHYPYYCDERAKGRGCPCTNPTLGLNQCAYCYQYQRGGVEPSSPLPVKTDHETDIYTNWYSNSDNWWTDKSWEKDNG